MECPQCGYVLDAFSTDCPRCIRRKDRPDVALDTTTLEAPAPQINPIPLPPEPAPRPKAAKVRVERYAPELGWPLTITLWFIIVLNTLILGLAFLASSVIFTISVSVIIATFVRIISAIALLRSKVWGFYVFGFITVGGILATISSGLNPVRLLIDLGPAILVVYFVLSKWDEFE